MILNMIDSSQWASQYGDKLYNYTFYRVKDKEYSEEIVQNTFLAALKAKQSYSGRSSVSTWLFGILKHKILDHFREIKKTKTRDFTARGGLKLCESEYNGKGQWQAAPVLWDRDPLIVLENKELLETLSKSLNKLPDKYRQVFIMREIDGLKSKEICRELKIAPDTLWVRLYRTRKQLKPMLANHHRSS